jgi:3-phosphoshikimate 1-carboxyvinyltransferase
MPLPELIEIVPLAGTARAEITVPGSKSITNRALVLAALGRGETTLQGALWSEDTQVMVDCLQALGFPVRVQPDVKEFCNRTISVSGLGGKIPRGGTPENPLELFVGNAGTAARFLAALVCLGTGIYRLSGVARMHERPQAALFSALRELGYRIDSPNDKLPAVIHGGGPKPGQCRVSIAESSQFASALLLSGTTGGWDVEVSGENAEESPYVSLTTKLMRAFEGSGFRVQGSGFEGAFQIEPDCSSGSYFWAAGEPGDIHVAHWPNSGWQMDERFPELWRGLRTLTSSSATISRLTDLGDSIMTAIAMAPLLERAVQFTDLGRLRVQECERVAALRTELSKCGAKVVETGDTLRVYPSALHGAEIETYNDHRMAMCFAILGLKVPGLRLHNPACVKKTFPNFFQKLAAPTPAGLGASLLDGASGRILRADELFAA